MGEGDNQILVEMTSNKWKIEQIYTIYRILHKPITLQFVQFLFYLWISQVRPLLPKERVGGEEICVRLIPSSRQVVLGKDRAFTFDEVFNSKTTQVCYNLNSFSHADAFWHICSRWLFVNSMLKGDIAHDENFNSFLTSF